MLKLIIFDLDGVIFDTEKNMIHSWREVKKKYKLKKNFKDYKKNVGLPFFKILKNLGINKNQKKIRESYKFHSIKNDNMIKLFPKVKSILKKLSKDFILAVVTSKDCVRTRRLIKKFNLSFQCISCPKKNLRGKPFPDQIYYVLKKTNIKDKSKVIYVGDTRFDYLAAKRAKINFIHASYGFEKKIKGSRNGIENFYEIAEYLYE